MFAPPVQSAYRHGTSPLYPYSLHLVEPASTLIDKPPKFQANPQQHQANQKKIAAAFKADGIRSSEESIAFLCDVAERVHSSFAISFKVPDFNKLKFLSQLSTPLNSLMVVSADREKRLYLSFKGNKIYEKMSPQGERIFKITEYVLLRFDHAGRLQSLENYVKMSAPFQQPSRFLKRISAIQQLHQYSFYPQTDDFVLYTDKKGREKVALYQRQAFCDLLQFHNDVLKLDELPDRRRICKEIVLATVTMHKKGLVHRDIKLENFLVYLERIERCHDTCAKKFCKIHQKVQVSLSDFEYVSAISDLEELRAQLGTPSWLAPEMAANTKTSLNGIALDIWGLGHIIYVFCKGLPHPICEYAKQRETLFEEINHIEKQMRTLANNELIQKELKQKLTTLLEERKKAPVDNKEKKEATAIEKRKSLLSKDLCTLRKFIKEFIESPSGLPLLIVDRVNVSAHMRRMIRTLDECSAELSPQKAPETQAESAPKADESNPDLIVLQTTLSMLDLAKAMPSVDNHAARSRLELVQSAKEMHAFLETTIGPDNDANRLLQVKSPFVEFLLKLLQNLGDITLTAAELEKAKEPFVARLQEKKAQKKAVDEKFEEIKQSLKAPQQRLITLSDLSQAMLVTDPASRILPQAALHFFQEEAQPSEPESCRIL